MNDQEAVSTRTLWLVNGNNLEFREDISRRAILCTMDARMERPGERRFDVNLKAELPGRRRELVPAALTVLRAFIGAGRPGTDRLTPFASFEEWSNLVRGALVWLDEPDPHETQAEITAVDTARDELAVLIEAWGRHIGTGAVVTAADLVRQAHELAMGQGEAELLQALEAVCPRGVNPKKLGWYLKKVKGQIARGRRIVPVREERVGLAYRLEVPG